MLFALATAALAMLFFPQVRGWALTRLTRWWSLGWRAGNSAASAGRQGLAGFGRWVAATANSLRDALRDALRGRGLWLGLGLLVLVGVPLLALLIRTRVVVDSSGDGNAPEVDARVLAMLQGEQLVPPPPLPPEMFTTPEVEQARPLIRYASREWALLNEQFRQRLLLVFQRMQQQHGYQLVLLEGYRSPERQAQLATIGPQVTRAGAGQSYHQYGMAADVAFMREGRIVISEKDDWALQGYKLYGEVAASFGLTWGGGWKSLRDYGHVEWRRPGVLPSRGDNATGSTAHAD